MTTATIVATIDSMMNPSSSNSNYGNSDHVTVSNIWAGDTKLEAMRGIGNFDLSSIPADATIDSAKLVQDIYTVDSGSRAATLYRCTRPDQWTEGGVTWNNYAASSPWTDAGGDYTDTDKITFTFPASTGEFDITGLKTLVEDARADRDDILSVIIHFDAETEGSGNDRYMWRSSEYGTPAERWRLVVEYTAAAGLPERSYPRGAGRGVLRGVA